MFEAAQRPRRIIAGPPVGGSPAPLDTATAVQQQRFQRELSLAGARSRWAKPVPMPMPAVQARDASPPQRDVPRDAPASEARAMPSVLAAASPPPQPNANASAPGAPGVRARRAVAPRAVAARGAPPPDLLPRRDLLADPEAWKHAGLPKPAPEDWDLDLALRVIQLCKRASPSFHAWSVTVPLDPTVLPDTELAMALTPSRLALRFKTHAAYSMALIKRHEPRLVSLLARGLPASREIDVEVA